MVSNATEPTARMGCVSADILLPHVLADDGGEVPLRLRRDGVRAGDDGRRQRAAAGAAALRRHPLDGLGDELLGHLGVPLQVGDDHVHGHAVVRRDASSRSR